MRFFLNLLLLTYILACSARHFYAQGEGFGGIKLSIIRENQITPNDEAITGAFVRTFYNTHYCRLDIFYGGTAVGGENGAPNDSRYRIMALDTLLNSISIHDTLPFAGASDYAITQGESDYYMLTGIPNGYQITRFNADIQVTGSAQIKNLVFPQYRLNDQMMGFTHGRIVFSANKPGTSGDFSQGGFRIFEMDTALNLFRDQIITGTGLSVEGAGVCFANNSNYIVGNVDRPSTQRPDNILYALQFDTNWVYQSKIVIDSPAMWPQSILYEEGKFYVVYQKQDDKRLMNIFLGIFDSLWQPVAIQPVSFYCQAVDSASAARPGILKRGNHIYISYDIESWGNKRDWQGVIRLYEMSQVAGPELVLGAPAHDFNFLRIGATDYRNLSLYNYGIAALIVDSIIVPPALNGVFQVSVVSGFPLTIPPAGSSEIKAEFWPTSIGPVRADLNILHNGADGSTRLTLLGTGADSIEAPMRIQPQDHAVNVDVATLFQWWPVDGATDYQMQVSQDLAFSEPLFGSDNLPRTDLRIPSNQGLDSGRVYYWRVRAKRDSLGDYKVSDYSSVWSFTTVGMVAVNENFRDKESTPALSSPLPNPFSNRIIIKYRALQTCRVVLTVYNIMGQEVTKLVDTEKTPGHYQSEWDATGHASGIYFYQLTIGNRRETRSILLLR